MAQPAEWEERTGGCSTLEVKWPQEYIKTSNQLKNTDMVWRLVQTLIQDRTPNLEVGTTHNFVSRHDVIASIFRKKAKKELRENELRGLGDLVEQTIKTLGVDKAVKQMIDVQICGCSGRRKWLNEKFPYEKHSSIRDKYKK